MKTWLVLVLAACGGTATNPPPSTISGSAPNHTPPLAPAVANAAVLAVEDATTTPPVVVIIDAGGKRSLAAAASWANLAAGKYSAGPKASNPTAAWMHIKEGVILGKDPTTIVDSFVDAVIGGEEGGSHDDPPPPEDEDEGGGTGTAMALDEGKMGGKGVKGRPTARLSKAFPPRNAAEPSRENSTVGEIGEPLDPQFAVVIAAPTAKAHEVVVAITETEGMIGVVHQATIRRLRLQFVRPRWDGSRNDVRVPADPPRAWVEVHFTADGVELEAVPDVPIAAKLDSEFATKLATAQKRRKAAAEGPVDVLVAPDTTAQRLVDVLVALDVAGVKTIGLGLAPKPGSEAAKLRGQRLPRVLLGLPNAMGDLDKKLIRESVYKHRATFVACYTQRLAKSPDLEGTVQTQFFITPNGKVAQATASGVDPDLANCVAAAVKKIEFSKPGGGGGVQVNYPMTFRR